MCDALDSCFRRNDKASGIENQVSRIQDFLLLAGQAEGVGDLGQADLLGEDYFWQRAYGCFVGPVE